MRSDVAASGGCQFREKTKSLTCQLGRLYRIETDYGVVTVYFRFRYEQHRQRLVRSNQYWALLKWFNHWFGSDGWVGRYELMGWQTFPSGARFLVERFEPNEVGAYILQARKSA